MYLRWLEGEVTKGEKAPTTADRYRGVLQRHVLPTLGNLELHEVNVGAIEDMLDAVAAHGIGAPTRRHVRIVVRNILHIAVRRGALPANPAGELPRIRSAGRSLPRALTPRNATTSWRRCAPTPTRSVPQSPTWWCSCSGRAAGSARRWPCDGTMLISLAWTSRAPQCPSCRWGQ